MPQADTFFIDAASKCIGGIHDRDIHSSINTSFSSTQQENWLFLFMLQLIHKSLNIVSYSACVVRLFPMDSYSCTF